MAFKGLYFWKVLIVERMPIGELWGAEYEKPMRT
jgi:hypothetical protein